MNDKININNYKNKTSNKNNKYNNQNKTTMTCSYNQTSTRLDRTQKNT